MKKILLWLGITLVSIVLGLLCAEFALRLSAPKPLAAGEAFMHAVFHPRYGFVGLPGKSWQLEREFRVESNFNQDFMSEEVEFVADPNQCDWLAVGDSHTMATGVGTQQSWPNAAEHLLNVDRATASVRIWNTGVGGYSLGQYLMRARDLYSKVKPKVLLIGFSTATDFYDVVPPSKGGFVYFNGFGRVYFDLDNVGKLVQHDELVGVNTLTQSSDASGTVEQSAVPFVVQVKNYLEGNSELYQSAKSSRLAVWLASRSTSQDSIWPSMDTVAKKVPSEQDRYRIALATAILRQMGVEAKAAGAVPILVKIPYLPEVYDEIWNNSFGMYPNLYDRGRAGELMREVAAQADMQLIDTTADFAAAVKQRGHWLHFPIDRHPNVEGQALIAEVVAKTLAPMMQQYCSQPRVNTAVDLPTAAATPINPQ